MSRTPVPGTVALAVPLLSLLLASSALGARIQKIALEGDPAPGTESGTVFAFTTSYFPLVPQISPDGQVSFASRLAGPSVTTVNDVGIWSGTPGATSLVVRSGDPAPGLGGATFQDFSLDFVIVTPEIGGSSLGILASLTGPGVTSADDVCVWKAQNGALSLVAREGDPAPGTPAGTTFLEPASLGVSDLGDLAVVADLSGPGVTVDDNQGFWTDRDGSLQLFLREGDPAAGLPPGIVYGGAGQFIGTGYTFQQVAFGRGSRFSLESSVVGGDVDTYSNETLYAESCGQLVLLAREGDPAPGAGAGVTFGGNGVVAGFSGVSTNGAGQSAFLARLGGSVSTQTAMFSDHTGQLEMLLKPLDPAPGTGGDQFSVFGTPLLGETGRVAFRSALVSGGAYPPLGIWWDQPGQPGELSALVIPGQALPSDPSVTILGTSSLYGFTAAGELAFHASLDDPVRGFRTAILMADAAGNLSVLLDAADPFDVHGDGSDLRTVNSFQVGGMSDDGTIAFRVDFLDGTFGFYAVGPGAATSAPLAAGGGALRLGPAAPNPFRGGTTLELQLPRPDHVTVDVLDVAGRRVARLVDRPMGEGAHPLAWNGKGTSGRPAASGIYFVRAVTTAGSEVRKIVRIE